MVELNPISSKILTVLLKRKTYANTSVIAKRAKVSWNTAELYLNSFYDFGWVSRKKVGRKYFWKARR